MKTFTVNRFDDGEGSRCVLARLGRTKLHVTFITENGIEHRALSKTKSTELKPLPFKGGEYPVQRLVKRFAAIGRARGITEAAKAELSAARN